MHWTGKWALGLALLAGAAMACGSEEAPRPKATPIGELGAPAPDSGEEQQNRPPIIQQVRLQPSRPTPGNSVAASVVARDPDGDKVSLSYSWRIDGERVGGDERTLFLGDASKGSVIELTVIARDDESQSEPEIVQVRVGNQPPVILAVVMEPLGEVRTGQNVSASPRAVDPDGDPLEFSYRWWVNGRPLNVVGPVLESTHFKRGDEIAISVVASDGQESSDPLLSEPFTVVNAAPTITSTPGAFDPDGTFRYMVAAEDPDGDRSFRYRLLEGPTGMEIDVVSGELSWTPTPGQQGDHAVKIEVGDRQGGTTTQSFQIHVEFEEVTESAPAAPAT